MKKEARTTIKDIQVNQRVNNYSNALNRKEARTVKKEIVLLKAMALILRYFSDFEPIQCILGGELEIHLWSFVGHEMTLDRWMSSFSDHMQTLSLEFWGNISWPSFSMGKVRCGIESICRDVIMMEILLCEH